MAEQQIQGVPEGLTEEPIKQQPTAVQGVPEGLTEEALPKSPKPAGVTKAPVAPVVIPPNKGKLPPPATKDILTQTDEMGGLPPAQAVVVKSARGVRGLYHGVMGDEENAASKGETTTASPEAANLGFTPEHVGYKAGEMVHGIGKFIKEGAQDIVGNEPIVIPDKGDTHGFADPKAHTLMSKYVTAPSMAERQASQDEMQKYFETKGPAAAGHAISAFLHGTLGEYVPAVGPLAMALTDQAQKGDLGGALAQIASLYAFEKGTGALKSGIKDRINAKVEELTKTPEVKQAEANVEATAKPREAAQAKYDAALAEHNKYSASHAQGIDSPKPVKAALDKAKAELDEHTAHHELAQEHLEKTKAAQPTIPQQVGGAAGRAIGKVLPTPEAAPEVPADKVEAAPVLTKLGAPKPPAVLKPINVKRPGEVQPETFPQTPKERPQSPLGRISLANDQGTMGKPPLLTEGTPIGPQVPKEGLPKIELPKQEVLPPEKPAKPERGNVKALTVDEKGNVQDKEETPEGRIGKLLQEALKPENIKPKLPENYKPENDQIGVREKMEHENAVEKVAKEDAEKTAAKAEEKPATEPGLMKTGEEGRELPKSAAEYHPAVQEQVTALPDEKLRQLAKAHGLNPDEYDFKARDEGRHRTERDQLAKDITEQMGEDEKINIGRQAEGLEHNAAMANKTKAERAASLFPRLRGPVDEFGNPKISGGAPEGATQTAKEKSDAADKVASSPTVNPEELKAAVDEFNSKQNRPPINSTHLGPDTRQDEMAEFYKKTPHTPNDPEVKKSYDALKKDVDKQYELAKSMGFKFDGTKGDTYSDSFKGLKDDVNNNKHVYVWQGADFPADHPLSAVDPKSGFTYAEKLLAIHDLFGHVAHDKNFTVNGEENAWNMHRQMFSPEAQAALATETRGRGAFGAKYKDFQSKAMLMPEHLQVRPEEVTSKLKDAANEYNKKEGRPPLNDKKIDVDARQQEMADAYANSKHEPNNPEVKKSYSALKNDIDKQYVLAEKQGYKFDAKENDPYEGEGVGNEKNAYSQLRKDAVENKHISTWKGGAPPADHPLSEVDSKTELTYNEKLRAIHDLFGHVLPDNDFTGKGEENAWNAHRQMFSKEALPALATETRGQTAYVEKNGKFADQRATILPEQFHSTSEEAAKGTLEHIKSGKDYAVLTAENPNNTRATPEENTKRNQALVADLRAKGYEPVSVEGNTKDVEGQKEHSFFVPDIKPSEAAELGRKHGQAAVLTTEGLHDLKTDTVNPSDNKTLKLGEEARKEPYYTKVGDQDFSVPIDFKKTVKPGEAPFSGTEKRTTERKAPLNAKETEDAMKNRKSFQNPFDVTEGANETIARDKMMPKHPSEEAAGKPKNQQGEPLSYEHNQDQHHVITTDARGKKIGELVAKDNAPNEVEVMSNQIYDKTLQGKGRGADQIKHLLYKLPDTTNVAKSDISTTEAARGAWDKVQQHAPEAVTKTTYKDGQVQYTVDMDKWRNGEGNLPKVSGGSQAGTAPAKVKDALSFIKDNSNVLSPGKVGVEDLGDANRRHFLLSDGSMISEKVPIHSDIEGMVGGKNLQAVKAIRMAGPAEFDVYSEPTDQQKRELGRLVKEYRDENSYGKIYWSIKDASGKDIGNAGTYSDFLRDLDTAYPVAPAAKVGKLPAIAEEHLTEEERAGVTKSEAGRKSFVEKLKKLPSVQEFTDIAKAGEGGRKWYQRSAAAFDALAEEAPKYFKEGDRQKFTDFLASTSPQQSVKMNLGETLNAWTHYVDEGRPEGKELEKLLKEHLTLPGAKIPNSMKALSGEPLWPDLSKNSNFKVPSFAKNLSGYLNHVTNDGWQALFGGLDAKAISKPTSYHPLAVVTRAAAEALGWEPAEAQAAIWAFTKTFTEKGETEPADIRRRSEDFADILAMDPEIRKQLAQLGVNHEQLDAKLRAIGKKPPVTPGASPTTENSVRKLSQRIEAARGKGTIPPPKSGSLNFEPDEEVGFNPEDFGTEEPLEKLGRKKSPLGRIK